MHSINHVPGILFESGSLAWNSTDSRGWTWPKACGHIYSESTQLIHPVQSPQEVDCKCWEGSWAAPFLVHPLNYLSFHWFHQAGDRQEASNHLCDTDGLQRTWKVNSHVNGLHPSPGEDPSWTAEHFANPWRNLVKITKQKSLPKHI